MSRLGRTSEYEEHKAVAEWLSYRPHILWTTVANDRMDVKIAMKLKRLGVAKGCPDILIFTPPPADKSLKDIFGDTGYVGVAIEMKAKDGKMSDAQRVWQFRLGEVAWYACTARGADAAIKILTDLGY